MLADQAAREAALDVHSSYCVSAPAGSGKTELLTQRVLALLLTVDEPEQVLAITFTRKARAEMLERITEALALGQGPEPQQDYKRKTWAAAKAVLARDSGRGWNLRLNPKRLRIQTIDSFHQSIAAESPLLNGFGTAPRAIDQARALYDAIIPKLLEAQQNQDPVSQALARILLLFDGDVARFGDYLAALLSKRDQWQFFLAATQEPHLFADLLKQNLGLWLQQDLSQLASILARFEGAIGDSLQFAAKHVVDGSLQALEASLCLPEPELSQLPQWQQLLTWLLTQKGEPRKTVTKKQGFPAKSAFKDKTEQAAAEQAKAAFIDFSQELWQEPELPQLAVAIANAPSQISQEQIDTVYDLLLILKYALACLQLQFAEQGECDHLQISAQALALMGEPHSTTPAKVRWVQRVRHILIDEYQDTSFSQNSLLAAMVSLWQEARELNPEQLRSLFVVGDGMQSIYRFRAANVGLFLQAMSGGIGFEALQHLQLSQNFRSKRGLVNWFNQTFADAFPKRANVAVGAVPYSKAVAADDSDQGEAHVLGFPDSESEARHIVTEAKRLLSQDQQASVAVLVRSRQLLSPVISALKAAELDFVGTDTELLLNIPAVFDAYQLACWLLNPADNVGFVAVLRAPWCGISNQQLLDLKRQLNPSHSWFLQLTDELIETLSADVQHCVEVWRSAWLARKQNSLPEQVISIWYALRGDAIAGQDFHYVQQFFDVLRENPTVASTSALAELFTTSYAKPLAKPNTVQLMTIHKSKGLEFDHVFMLGLAASSRPEQPDLLEFSERLLDDGSNSFLLSAFGRSAGDKALRAYIKRLDRLAATNEALRVLYVGATRAVKSLTLSWVYKLDAKTEQPKPPAAGSLLGMIWPVVSDQAHYPTIQHKLEANGQLAGVYRLVCQDLTAPKFPAALTLPVPNTNVQDDHTSSEAQLGILVHQLLETIASIGLERCQPHLVYQIGSQKIEQAIEIDDKPSAKNQLNEIVNSLFNSDTARWVLAYRDNAKSEWSLSSVDGDGHLQQHIIDRCFQEGDTFWIIDYKISSPAPEESIAEFTRNQALRYQKQLSRYHSLVSQLPHHCAEIKTALYFPTVDVLHEVAVA